MLVAIIGVCGGIFLSVTGKEALGTPVLIGSFTMLSTLAGKFIGGSNKEDD
jgi:putative Mn2+ efflux pump MntP